VVLSQYRGETRGMPSTIIHMLPVEVMLFVEMLPYYLLNRQDTKHTFWTSLAAILNFKYWAEDALETGNLKFLSFVVNCLKADNLNKLLVEVAALSDKSYVNLDTTSLKAEDFVVHDVEVAKEDFSKVLCNQIFLLKFKVVDWEGRDDYTNPAKVLPRDPPKIVFSYVRETYKAVYNPEDFESEDTDPPPSLVTAVEASPGENDEGEYIERSQTIGEKRKPTKSCTTENPHKKIRITEEEWDQLLGEAGISQVEENTQSQSMSPYIQQAQTPPPPPSLVQEASATSSIQNPESITLTAISETKQPLHLHFHFGTYEGTNIISYESCETKFKIAIDSRSHSK